MHCPKHNFTRLFTVIAIALVGAVFFFSQTTNSLAVAGINRQINFQGKLVNNPINTNVTDTSYTIVFTIYDRASGGTALWSESQSVTTTDGIFRVALGSQTPFPSDFNFNWSGLYLGIKVNADSEMTPRIQLAAVPYAFNSEKVAGLTVQDTSGNASTSGTLQIANAKTFNLGTNNLTFTTSGDTTLTLPTSGTVCTTITCLTSAINWWNQVGGLLYPTDTTYDFAVGGSASTSAAFLVHSGAAGSGTLSVASISGQTSFATLVVNNDGVGDLFTASASGTNRFVITNSGSVGINNSLPQFDLDIGGTPTIGNSLGGLTISGKPSAASKAGSGTIVITEGTSNYPGGDVTVAGGTSSGGYGALSGAQIQAKGFNYYGGANLVLTIGRSINSSPDGSNALLVNDNFGNNRLSVIDTGKVGIGTTEPWVRLDVRGGTSNTEGVASISGKTAIAALTVNNDGTGNLFSASSGGATKFTIDRNGNLGIGGTYVSSSNYISAANFSVSNAGLITAASGLTLTSGPITLGGSTGTGQCITGGATASWGSCGTGGGTSWWNQVGGLVYPASSLYDFAIGGTSTASATFKVTGTGPGAQTLPTVAINGTTSFAALAVNNNGVGDLFTASSSGFTRFTVGSYGQVFAGSAISATEQILGTSSASLISAYKGFNGYTNFSGGIGTGGTDSITNAQRITSTGNLTNIGSIQSGELLVRNAGQFASKVDYTAGTTPFGLAFGDLNGDGKADMAVTNDGSTNVSVFINKGDGTFNGKVDYTTGSNPESVSIADLNGDGKADMAVTNWNSTSVSVFINKGDGTFNGKVDYTTGSNPQGVSIADLNGDGKADMAVTNWGSTSVSVFINKGDGTFNGKVDYTTGSNPYYLAIGDLNGDGKSDIAVANSFSTTISVLINKGDGTFNGKIDYTVGSGPYSVAIADLNGDGMADMVSANNGSTNISVLINKGDGSFNPKQDYTTSPADPTDIALGDLNGDGKTDIAVSTSSTTKMSVFINTGNGTFAPKQDYTTNTNPLGIAMGDLNGDGKADLAIANSGTTNVSVFINQSNPILFAQAVTGRVGIGISSTPSATFDVRGTFQQNAGTLAIASISGQTSFASLVVNNDGVGDLFTASASGYTRFAITNAGAFNLLGSYGNNGDCLKSGGSATTGVSWGSCGTGGGTSWWNQVGGLLYPTDTNYDFAVGGSATTSALFSFTGVISGNTIASVSGRLIIMPNNGYGNVGIGTTTPTSILTVNGPNVSNQTIVDFQSGGTSKFTINTTNGLTLIPGSSANGSIPTALVLGLKGAINVTSETIPVQINAPSYTITGNYANQRITQFTQPTFTAASTLGISTEADTVNISGAPITAGSATIANAVALRIASGTSVASGVTNAYGLYVDAPTGAANNYAASFLTGNVGIGTDTPAAKLQVVGGSVYIDSGSTYSLSGSFNPAFWGISKQSNNIQIFAPNAAGDKFQISDSSSGKVWLNVNYDNGRVSIGGVTTSPLATLDIRANIIDGGTVAVASVSGKTSFASLVANNDGVGDLFTASASGYTRFKIANNGDLTLFGAIYLGGSNGSGQCLQGGAVASWGSCGGGSGVNWWNELGGALSPARLTDDLLLGGSSTSSAVFSFQNINPSSGANPRLTIWDSTSQNNGLWFTSSATGASIDATSGTINIGHGGGTLFIETDIQNDSANNLGAIQITDRLNILPASTSNNVNASLLVNNPGSGDIFTASSSGTTKLTLTNTGRLNLLGGLASDIDTLSATTLTIAGTTASGLVLGNSTVSSMTFNVATAGNFVFKKNGSAFTCSGTDKLTLDGSGFLTCATDQTGGGSGVNWWNQLAGALSPIDTTNDFLLGSSATSSALFSYTGVKTGLTQASVSGKLIVLANNGYGGNIAVNKTNALAGVDIKDTNSAAIVGSEKITATADRDFSSDTGNWTTSGSPPWKINIASSGVAAKNAPGTGAITLSNSALDSAPVSGNIYIVTFTYTTTASSSGSLLVSIGGVNGIAVGNEINGSNTQVQNLTATNTNSLMFTPSSGWYGTIDNVFVKQVSRSSVALRIESSNGSSTPIEFRATANSYNNLFIGQNTGSLWSSIIGGNTGVGSQSLSNLSYSAGAGNTALGNYSLQYNSTGNYNTAIGNSAMLYQINGAYNTSLGAYSLYNNTIGSNNVALGFYSLKNSSTGGNNAGLGYNSGNSLTTGNNNLFLGYNSNIGQGHLFNAGAIGANSYVNQSDSLVLGSIEGINSATGSARIGIGTTTPAVTFDLRGFSTLNAGTLGVASISGKTSYSSLVANNDGVGDIFTASSSGWTRFTVSSTGKVTIGTATNGLTFDPVNGGPTYAGTGRPTKTITLSPEYAGAILTASGSATITGSMTSDASSSAALSNYRTYYEWSATSDTLQDYTVAVRVTLPQDFDDWDSTSNNAMKINYQTASSVTATNKVDVFVYNADSSLSKPGNPVILRQGLASTTWTSKDIDRSDLIDNAEGITTAGQTMIIYLKMYASGTYNMSRIGDIVLNYKAKF